MKSITKEKTDLILARTYFKMLNDSMRNRSKDSIIVDDIIEAQKTSIGEIILGKDYVIIGYDNLPMVCRITKKNSRDRIITCEFLNLKYPMVELTYREVKRLYRIRSVSRIRNWDVFSTKNLNLIDIKGMGQYENHT